MPKVPSTVEMDNLRKNIVKYADYRGISMRKLSEQSGLSKNYVTNFVNHYIEYPEIDKIIAIANTLDVRLYTLFIPNESTYGNISDNLEIAINVPKEELDLFIKLKNTIKENESNK